MLQPSALRGVLGLRTLLLLLVWPLLWAPAHGILIPSRAVALSSDDAGQVHLHAEAQTLAVIQQPPTGLSASTAAAAIPPWSLQPGGVKHLSASRRLLQPPGLPPAARDVTLQELLANIDVSADGSGGVRVALPPVPPPNRSSGSNSSANKRPDDRGLPPVVVSLSATAIARLGSLQEYLCCVQHVF